MRQAIVTVICSRISASINLNYFNPDFSDFTTEFFKIMKQQNGLEQMTNYQDIHVKEMLILTPIIYALCVIVMIIDILGLLMFLFADKGLPLFLINNSILLSLLLYLKQNKSAK